MAKDTCIMCGVETAYDIETHVDMRLGYIEGAGQLCAECYLKGTDREHITIPKRFINEYPNDMELGSKVRKFFHDTYE